MSTFRHVLMIRFSEEATENQIEELYRGLGRLPAVIEEIQRYEFGPDLGLGEGNPDMALIADFEPRMTGAPIRTIPSTGWWPRTWSSRSPGS